jgi:dolichol-phosphate mannosyltransferase
MPESVLIAGTSGQLGPAVARAFVDAGWRVVSLQRRGCAPAGTQAMMLPDDWSGEALAAATRGLKVDAVINLVGAGVDPGTRAPDHLAAVNVALARRLAELAGQLGARAFVNLGSGSEYRPSDAQALDEGAAENDAEPYARTKAEGGRRALAACADAGVAAAHVRLFGMYGESERGHRLLPTIVRAHQEGGRAKLSAGAQVRDWLYEQDVGEALVRLAQALLDGRASSGLYNLGSGAGTTVRSFAQIAAELLGGEPDLLEFGAVGLRDGEGNRLVADTAKLRAATGWTPRHDLRAGLSRAIAQMQHPVSASRVTRESGSRARGSRKLISFCIPVYNESANIERLISRLQSTAASLAERYDFEFLFTDNCSEDDTVARLKAAAAHEPRIRIIRLSRNFGFQKSILTNYLNARGDALIQLDADLQDPPEMAAEFLARWERGYKVVYGVRRKRHESRLMQRVRKAGYAFISNLSEEPIPLDAGDFRLIDRVIVEALQEYNDYAPYLRGAIATLGYPQVGIEYDRAQREAGKSNFGIREVIRLGMDGLFSTSMVPLRLATWVGVIALAVSVLAIPFYIIARYTNPSFPTGLASIYIFILTSMGVNALLLGVFGEYIGRIFRNTRGGPITIVQERFDGAADVPPAPARDEARPTQERES